MNTFYTNITFLSPFAFWLFALLPIVLFLHIRSQKNGIQALFLDDVRKIYGSGRYKSISPLLLKLCILSIGIIALANPVSTSTKKEVEKNGIDIILALDISKSMLAEDMTPNRLEIAKKTIDAFIEKRTNDRIGIIIFAGKPFASSPLSFDHDGIRLLLSDTTTDSIDQSIPGLSGTAIGDAILSAVDMLTKETKTTASRSQTIILLTDGEANIWVKPEIAAKYAKERNISISTIGIGKNDRSPLFTTDPLTGKKQYFLDETGKPIIASINTEGLREIAHLTGGSSHLATDEKTLTHIFDVIDGLKKTKATEKTTTSHAPLGGYLALPFFVLLALFISHELRTLR